MGVYNGPPILDRDLVKIESDHAVKFWAYQNFQWLYWLEAGNLRIKTGIKNDVKHYWKNDPEGLVATTLTADMTGGEATEEVTVADTSIFTVGNKVLFGRKGTVDARVYYITAIADATTMTVASLSTDAIAAHGAGTNIVLANSRIKYDDKLLSQPTRLQTVDSNTVELVFAARTMASILADAEDIGGETFMSTIMKQLVSTFKQNLTMATLLGTEEEAVGAGGYGSMAGLAELVIAGGNTVGVGKTPPALTKPLMREFVMGIAKRGGFPNGEGVIIHNAAWKNAIYKLDDASYVTKLVRDREDRFDRQSIFGYTFDLIQEPALDKYAGSDTEAVAIFLSPTSNGAPNVRLARKGSFPLGNGQPHEVLKETNRTEFQIALPCTLEVRNQYMHGMMIASTGS